tara:strand:- start:1027 stop:2214 length:1188 start_codon:yes stop_codon:yes gene_type:complete
MTAALLGITTMKVTFDKAKTNKPKPWRKSWQDVNKKQHRKFFATKEEADAYEPESVVDATKYGVDFASLNQRDRQAAVLAITESHKYSFNLMEAVQFYIQHHSDKPDILASVAVEEQLASRKGYRKSTERTLRGTLRAFAAYEDLPLRQYTRDDIMEFCQAGELSTSSRHGNLTRLGTFFNWAMRRGYVFSNPCKKIKKKADLGVVPPRSITFFKYDEVERLMNTALETDPGMIPYLTLAIFCGIRPHELSGADGKQPVTWDDILIDEDIAEVNVPSTSSKTREPRQIELNDNALEWLKLGGDLPPRNIRDRRNAIARKADVKWSEDIMRHTFASYHCRMFRSPERLKLEMGHSENSKTLENHYRSGRCTLKDARKFWTLVPSGAQNILNPALSA